MDFRFYSHEYRKRKKKRDKEREQQYIALKDEVKALRQLVIELREGIDRNQWKTSYNPDTYIGERHWTAPLFWLTFPDIEGIIIIVGFFRQEGGVLHLEYLFSFITAVLARLVGDCVSKWLNSRKKSDK